MKRLAAMQLCPLLIEARLHAGLRGLVQVGVLQHQVGIGAPQLQHRLLEDGTRLGGHRLAGRRAPGEGDGADPAVLEDLLHPVARHQQRAERVLGEAGVTEHGLDGQRAAGDVRRVLEHPHVPRHQGRCREAVHLPEGKFQGITASTGPRGWKAT
jgi:hypothetical protein